MTSYFVEPFRALLGLGNNLDNQTVAGDIRTRSASRKRTQEQETIDLISDSEHDHDRYRTKRSRTKTYSAPTSHPLSSADPRAHIENAYPNPLDGRPVTGSHGLGEKNIQTMTDNDDIRLLGDFREPKGATPISIPRSIHALSVPQIAKSGQSLGSTRKPGAQGSFHPKNTLQGVSRFENQKTTPARDVSRQAGRVQSRSTPRVLELESSRGSNVTTTSRHVPDDIHPNKRQKHSTSSEASGMQYSEPIELDLSDDDVQQTVRRGLRSSPPTQSIPSQSRPGLQAWEVSGSQEFRKVAGVMARGKDRAQRNSPAKVAQFLNRDQPAALRRLAAIEINSSTKAAADEQQRNDSSAVRDLKSEESVGALEEPRSVRINDRRLRRPVQPANVLSPYFNVRQSRGKAAPGDDVDNSQKSHTWPSKLSDISVESDDELSLPVVTTKHPDSNLRRTRSPQHDTHAHSNGRTMTSKEPADSTQVLQETVSSTRHVDDELDSANIAPARLSRARASRTSHGPSDGDQDGIRYRFKVDEFVGPGGNRIKSFEPMVLYFDDRSNVSLKFRDPEEKLRSWTLEARTIVKVRHSLENNCPYLRIYQPGNVLHDLRFHEHQDLRDFLVKLKNVARVNEDTRTSHFMEKIYGQRDPPKPIDEGIEDDLLKSRISGGKTSSSERQAAARRLRESRSPVSSRRTTPVEVQDESKPPFRSKAEITRGSDIGIARQNPSRSARSRRLIREPTPLAERFSHIHGLGIPWEQPIVYPETGKRRVTVEFSDLERLDEGEFLNDSLIEFYIRWLQEKFRESSANVAFLSTHFYSKLSDSRKGINYTAVEKWTKEDIFSRDFVIVPVNENTHWYIAIICNLPSVQRKFTETDGSSSNPVDLSNSYAADSVENKSGPEPMSSRPQTPDMEEAQMKTVNGNNSDSVVDEIGDSQFDNSGIFSNASQTTPVKKSGRRKSGPTKRYPADLPAIAILDSLAGSHTRTLANLKDYVVAEAKTKRSMDVPREVLQGMHAKNIPMQDNYSDCGVFVCGYIHHFMSDPREFGRKLLAKEFDIESDWPEMNPTLMRNNMRETLQAIAAEQKESRRQKKAHKRRMKQKEPDGGPAEAASTAPSPPKQANETTGTNLSSPLQKLRTGESNVAEETQEADDMLFSSQNAASLQPQCKLSAPQKKESEEWAPSGQLLLAGLEEAANAAAPLPNAVGEGVVEPEPTRIFEIPDSQPSEEEKGKQARSGLPDATAQNERRDETASTNSEVQDSSWSF